MSLQKLTWKYIKYAVPSHSSSIEDFVNCIFDAFNENSYQDGTLRVTGSGVAWSFFRTSSIPSGSNSIIYGYPATMSIMSQSVIIVGSSSAPPVSPTTVPSYTYSSTAINIALQKQANTLQYRSWLSGSIFNSGSSGQNTVSCSGFMSLVNNPTAKSIRQFHILESQESLCIITEYTTQFSYAVAGAFIDPETSLTTLNSEKDGNLYALTATHGLGVDTNTTWLSVNPIASLFHSGVNSTSAPKFVYYIPNTDLISRSIYNFSQISSTKFFVNNDVIVPLYCLDANLKVDLGRFREISYVSLNGSGVSSIKSGSYNRGILFSPQIQSQTIGDSLFFKG